MAKASFTLPNGTVVQLEGTTEDIQSLLEFYGGKSIRPPEIKPGRPATRKTMPGQAAEPSGADFTHIVTLAKDCDEADKIETRILDRSSQVDRTLLPLYIVHEYLGNAFGLTSGEISKVTTDLSIPISQPNASKTLSGTASRYVIGDKVKKRGQAVRYKLSRRGVKYIKSVLEGTEGED